MVEIIIYIAEFSLGVYLWGGILSKIAKHFVKITKSLFLGAKQWGTLGKQGNFLGS